MASRLPHLAAVLLIAVGLGAPGTRAADGAAVPQDNRSRSFGPGRCGPADPTHIRVASYTGGQPYFLSPSEIGQSAGLMEDAGRSHIELILWASAVSAGSVHEYTIPVDPSIERLTVSASFDAQGGRLVVPDVPAGTEKEETILNCVHLAAINRPAAGPLRVQVVGTGRFWLRAQARTDLSFSGAEFVRPGGRPGHEGLFRIDGEPLAGRPATLRAFMSEARVATREFAALSAEGRVLRALELAETRADTFVGTFVPPEEPFRVVVTGVDEAGFPYQRLHGPLFHAERVEIAALDLIEPLQPGELKAVPFLLRNHDRRARYRIVATAGSTLADRVEPAVLELDEGGEGAVTVWMTVPPDATGRLDVRVTATNEDDPARFNSGVSRLTVKER